MSLYTRDMCLLSGPPASCQDAVASSPPSAVPGRVYPLTKSQEGMWTEFQMSPDSTQYNLTLEWDLLSMASGRAPPTITDIFRVIHKLTARHAILRSTIVVLEGKAHVQEFAVDDVDPEVCVVYRETCPIAEHAMTRVLRKPFALQSQLPARWVILQDPKAFRVYLVGHHIVVDGQSMSILSREFVDLLQDLDTVLPPPVPFSAMHMAERAWATSQAHLDSQRALMDQVRDQSNASWSGDVSKPSTASDTYRAIDDWCTFPKSELDVWSQMFKTSWFRVATALVGLLVVDKKRPQYGKDELLAVGFGSRPRDMAACVGQFANALPVRVPLWKALETADGSFRDLVAAVGRNVSAVKKAELFPAAQVARSCRRFNIDYQPPRVAVTYSPKLARPECRLFPVEGSWDLFFCFLEYDADVKLGVIYNPQVFSTATMKVMRRQFDAMVALSRVDGAKLVDMLGWLPRHPCLPATPAEAQPNPLRHVHHWFDAHAESSPSSLALVSAEEGKSMTYAELYRSSEAKAKFLTKRNVCRGDSVLIHLPRGFATIEWILAILKCGAAFVYLDVDFTERQRTAIVDNCKPSLIVDESLLSEVSQDAGDSTAGSIDGVKYATSDDDVAYMIYTSGSTGEPKGVVIDHGNLTAFVQASKDVLQFGFGARVLQLASFSFDASVIEWTGALCTGASLCFAQYPKQLVGDYLAEVIEKNNVTIMEITPTALETLPLEAELPSLQQISVGGEAPSHDTFAKWHPRVSLVNVYGPTETTVVVAFNRIDKSDKLPDLISAGPLNPKMAAHICAEGFGAILGAGVEGEICLSGPQVSRGYCERPHLTAKSFVVHPETGERMYRTGDKGMLLEDGSLVIMGRIDRELKVRGFRIAPEEIENAILSAGVGVHETSVQKSESGLEMLAFVAPSTVSPKAVTSALKNMLPAYKIPSTIHVVESLPKNSNGKIDHKAVRARRAELVRCNTSEGVDFLDSSDAETELSHDDQPADVEATVAHIWQSVLGVSSPPTDVNFFDIGGHSLLVPKLHEKLKAAFPSKAVRVVDLFHKSTIKSQAMLLGDGKKAAKGRHLRRRRTVVKTPATLSSAVSTVDETPVFTRTAATSVSEFPETPGMAIVGMAGRFPGAKNVDDFFSMLMNGQSGIRESPTCDGRQTLPENIWVPRAGVLDDIEDFDHEFWSLSEEDATEMDPQQRLFLEVAFEALADAGIDGRSMNGERLGVFVGSANHAYHLHTESVASDAFMRENRGFVAPSISTRTAYHLNARGPNVTIQTNCASSTVALSQAVDAIRLGRCDMALVGGVSVQLYDGGYVTQKGQIFSPRGECHPFDSKADGTVPADAVTAVVLKRYSAAVCDGTPVYARILGTGIGADGALDKAGFQVPSPRGQADVIKSAWEVAELTAERLKYAEIHGSGTPIGDALELEGLSLAVTELGGGNRQFTVGSTKGNIGNAQHSSGLVSLIKLCKSMQAGVVPATKGLEQANPMISSSLPVTLASKQTRLDPDDILAVSAAGWGGVNSHIVLGSPDQHLRKDRTLLVPEGTFKRKTLRAPRLKRSRRGSASLATLVFSTCASDVLGVSVDDDTDLKQHGLDSKAYSLLVGEASKRLPGPCVGVKGMLLGACTPSALAQIYHDQVRGAKSHGVTCTILQVGQDATMFVLPGTGGSCAAAHGLLERLPRGITVVALEHPGEDPSMAHVDGYLEALQPWMKAPRLIVVGMSLGGLSALRLAAALGEHDSALDIGLVALDSPRIDTWPQLEKTLSRATVHVSHAAYIGATAGQLGKEPLVKEQWEGMMPGISMHELDCGHCDLWATSKAGETATIIDTLVREMLE